MTHVIFDPCIRDGACADVCPVACILPGQPEAVWPWYYVDPDACIDCGDCVPVCPVDAICPEEKLPRETRGRAGDQCPLFPGETRLSCSHVPSPQGRCIANECGSLTPLHRGGASSF